MNPETPHKSKPYSQAYNIFLFYLAVNTSLSRDFIVPLSDNERTSYRNISRALKRGHIQEKKISYKSQSRGYRNTYYTLTPEGLRYLTQDNIDLPESMQWIQTVEFPDKRIVTTGAYLNPEKVNRFLSVSGSALMCSLAGAYSLPLTVPEYDTENDSRTIERAAKVIKDTYMNLTGIGQNFSVSALKEDNGAYFWDVYTVKNLLAGNEKAATSAMRIGRYTGILESHSKSVIVYVGNKGGMAWTETATHSERNAHHRFDSVYSLYKKLDMSSNHAVMFVENERMFESLYRGSHKDSIKSQKRSPNSSTVSKLSKSKDCQLGYGYDSFVVFPTTRDGVYNLAQYISDTTSILLSTLVSLAVQSGVYTENTGKLSSMFPLITRNGKYVFIGVFIDTVGLHNLIDLTEWLHIDDYCILCYKWQAYYYRRVLPESVQYMLIENN